MTLHADYDPDNIFAKMLRGEVPCVKVFEDDVALAFMDIFPQAEGHTLVIPKDVEPLYETRAESHEGRREGPQT